MTSKISYFNRKTMPTRPRRLSEPNPGVCTRLDLEIYILKERILYIMDKTLYKIEVAVSLPFLLANDCELLHSLLTDKELSLIGECELTRFSGQERRHRQEDKEMKKSVRKLNFEQGDKVMEGFGSFFMLSSKESYVNVVGSNSKREDPGVSRVIHMLCSRPRARLRKLIKDKGSEISPGGLNLLRNLYQLRTFIDDRLKTTPTALSRRDGELRFAWRRNEKAKLEIVKLINKLEIQRNEGLDLLESRDYLIAQQQIKLSKQVHSCRDDIRDIIRSSEAHMVAECTNYELKAQELVQEIKGTTSKLDFLLREHLQQEKSLRAKRLRIEGQLAAWVEKYDQDIGEKQAEFDDTKEGFEAEVQEMLILQDEFDIQEEDYVRLMAEKEAVYQHELEEKMFIFICNRAARRIQKYWRAYRERKLARKKRHKHKKGKGSGKTK